MENVKIWEESVMIPTYEVGEPDKNPMFLEKRVYQGSSGKIYPYPTTEKISREKRDKSYQAVFLENEYLKVMVLPELGGRIQRAYDKTNGYDFVYYNHVIKPALVGLTGPWISGGIEFNWPQHHRPTTFMPVDHVIRENEDGSKTLLVNDVDQMYGTKGITAFTLYPDRAYIEIQGQLYNKTPLPQTFLWWANPAVAVNDQTQSIFPPDVHSVYDHGKRDVSRFPIATGIYYKYDYSRGVDISRYKNIPVPTSYMAEKSEYDFVGGYDYGKHAGILHVADHHVSPGKKQWTWGCGDFGKAWDRNLTDEDGPYIELMTGVYTDNQPDFTWLKPFEEKTFKQYFMPYKAVGQVKNATTDAMVNMEVKENGVYVCVYATKRYKDAQIILMVNGKEEKRDQAVISPTDIYENTFQINETDETKIKVCVEWKGKILVSYQPKKQRIPKLAEPAKAAKAPEDIMTNEELYLTGQHIEQYRHATYLPDPYYAEGLKRDPGDIRINNAYGMLLLRRGCFADAEKYFRKAIERLTSMNPNPYDSEAYYNLGLALFYEEKYEQAYDAFFKATWTNEQQEMAFYYLAVIAARNHQWEMARGFIEKSLVKNDHNVKARGLKATILRCLNLQEENEKWMQANLKLDPFDYRTLFEQVFSGEEKQLDVIDERSREFHETYLQIARDYAECGCYKEACEVLKNCRSDKPMIHYYTAYYQELLGNQSEAEEETFYAEKASPLYCFPNKLEDIRVLEAAISRNPKGAKAYYYLGCLYYDKLQFDKAIGLWETSECLDDTYPTLLRNLAVASYNKKSDPERARKCLERAFELDPTDARVFLELDQLYKKLHMTAEKRLENYKKHLELIQERDDLYTEYVTVLNLCRQYKAAYDAVMDHQFRAWEGAEGRITTQYKTALLEMAKEAMRAGMYEQAKEYLEKAMLYPENLGEGRLEGTKDNHLFYTLGLVLEHLGQENEAKECYKKATLGTMEPAGMLYYYDQPADMILYQGLAQKKLENQPEANTRFYKLVDYGEKHVRDHVKLDYFAVSLPDFLIFEEDLDKRNQAHCYYLMGLGMLGLGNDEKARENFEKALVLDPAHENAAIYLHMTGIIEVY